MTSGSKSIFVVVVVVFLNSRIMSDFILLLYFFGRFYFTFSTLVVRKTIFNDKKAGYTVFFLWRPFALRQHRVSTAP